MTRRRAPRLQAVADSAKVLDRQIGHCDLQLKRIKNVLIEIRCRNPPP